MNARICSLCFCLFALLFGSHGQETGSCQLLDSVSKEPVSFATISTDSITVYSDLLGYFSPDGLKGESCLIRRIGYKAVRIQVSEIGSTILLMPQAYQIKEVVITGNTEVFEVGYHRMKTIGTSMVISNYTQVLYFERPYENSTISTVFVHTHGNSKGDQYVLSFFSVDEKYEPEEFIFAQDYIAPSGKDMLEIPLSSEVRIPDEGIFIGISRKEESNVDQNILVYSTINLAESKKKQYTYILRDNQWTDDIKGRLRGNTVFKIGMKVSKE